MNEQDQVKLNKQVQRELEEVRREASKAYSLDREIDPVPDSAYDDLWSLLVLLPEDIPAPDPGWAEDGSLSLEWRPENGIVTMGYTVTNSLSMVLFSIDIITIYL